jgi:hypothetical protein
MRIADMDAGRRAVPAFRHAPLAATAGNAFFSPDGVARASPHLDKRLFVILFSPRRRGEDRHAPG